jgi:4-hydroxybenzoate polyprenyltransferase
MLNWLHLCRVSNLPTVWSNVLAGWLLAGGAMSPGLCWMLLAGSLMYGGGMVLNDVCDAAHDRQHQVHRPIAAGRVSWKAALVGALAMLGIGLMAGIKADASPWLLVGLLAGIVAYDLYHKPWAGSVLIMGLCRSLLFLAAASAAGPWQELWPQAAALGLYVLGITAVARLEAAAARTGRSGPHLAHLALIAPLLLAIAGSARLSLSAPALLCPLAFVLVVGMALKRMRLGGPQIGAAVGLLLAAMPLVDALALLPDQPSLAISLLPLPIALRLWQRWIAAT